MVSLLLSKSTNQIHVKDKRERTGLHLASDHGHIDMISLLLGQGADINGFDKVPSSSFYRVSECWSIRLVILTVTANYIIEK